METRQHPTLKETSNRKSSTNAHDLRLARDDWSHHLPTQTNLVITTREKPFGQRLKVDFEGPFEHMHRIPMYDPCSCTPFRHRCQRQSHCASCACRPASTKSTVEMHNDNLGWLKPPNKTHRNESCNARAAFRDSKHKFQTREQERFWPAKPKLVFTARTKPHVDQNRAESERTNQTHAPSQKPQASFLSKTRLHQHAQEP